MFRPPAPRALTLVVTATVALGVLPVRAATTVEPIPQTASVAKQRLGTMPPPVRWWYPKNPQTPPPLIRYEAYMKGQ